MGICRLVSPLFVEWISEGGHAYAEHPYPSWDILVDFGIVGGTQRNMDGVAELPCLPRLEVIEVGLCCCSMCICYFPCSMTMTDTRCGSWSDCVGPRCAARGGLISAGEVLLDIGGLLVTAGESLIIAEDVRIDARAVLLDIRGSLISPSGFLMIAWDVWISARAIGVVA